MCFSALIGAIKTPTAGVHAAWRRFGGVLCTWLFCGFPPGTQQEATSIARLGGKCRGRTLSNDPGEKAVLLRYHRAQKWTLKNSRFTTSRFWSEPPVLRGTGRPPQGVSDNSAAAEVSGRCRGIKDCGGPWVHVDSCKRKNSKRDLLGLRGGGQPSTVAAPWDSAG